MKVSKDIAHMIQSIESSKSSKGGRGIKGGIQDLARAMGVGYSIMRKIQTMIKIANGGPLRCSNCGCPHIEALTIGHFGGSGRSHARAVGDIRSWISRAPIGEVVSTVRIECVYCNYVHAWTGEYPDSTSMPIWSGSINE